MTQERRGGGRRTKSARGGGLVPQLPWSAVHNPHAPLELASEEQIEAIHKASMRVLSELGIRVMGPRVMDLFETAGAIVDRSDSTIRIDESLIGEALKTVPPTFTLTSRNPAKRLTIGGRGLAFGLVAGPPNVHDCINGRRAGNLADYQNFIRLAHYFNVIHLIGNQVTAPQELPANTRHLDTYLANLTLSDLTYHCTAIGRGRALDGIAMMAIARGISIDEMALDPGVTTIISINSPRLLDDAMAEGLIAMAQHGQPVTITPFTLMGAMTPVTLPAALVQQNAEALFGVALTQLVRPGTPVMYGAFTSNVDMRSGAPAFGTPENTKANLIAGPACPTLPAALSHLERQCLQCRRSSGRLRDLHGDLGRRHGGRQSRLSRGRLARRRPHGLLREAYPRRRDPAEHDRGAAAHRLLRGRTRVRGH